MVCAVYFGASPSRLPSSFKRKRTWKRAFVPRLGPPIPAMRWIWCGCAHSAGSGSWVVFFVERQCFVFPMSQQNCEFGLRVYVDGSVQIIAKVVSVSVSRFSLFCFSLFLLSLCWSSLSSLPLNVINVKVIPAKVTSALIANHCSDYQYWCHPRQSYYHFDC